MVLRLVLILVGPVDVLEAILATDVQIVVDPTAGLELVDVLRLHVHDVRVVNRRKERLPEGHRVGAARSVRVRPEAADFEVLRVHPRGDLRGLSDDDVVVDQSFGDLGLSVVVPEEDTGVDVSDQVTRDFSREPASGAGHVLVGNELGVANGPGRHRAAPARHVVVPGRQAVGGLAVPPGRPDGPVRVVVRAVSDVDAVRSFAGSLRDDVDDAVEGVGAVERRPRAADDLDSLDVFDADGQRRPDRRAEQIDVEAPSVDEDEHLVREALVEAAHRDLGLRPGHLHDVDAREATKQLGELRESREPDVLLRDDRRRTRRVERTLGLLGRGDDRLLEDLFGLERTGGPGGPRSERAGRSRTTGPGGAGRAARERPRSRSHPSRDPGTRHARGGLRLLRLEQHRLLLARALLEARDDLRDLVAIPGPALEVLLVVDDRVVEIPHVHVGAGDVVEDVRVRKDLVRRLELLDARVVATIRDRGHALLEVAARLGALVGAGGA